MEGHPPISCMCPTYGRPSSVVEESIQSFLQQDYPGTKELLILNDLEGQELIFDHPEVRIINVPKRFRTVGEKRNATVALCSHDWIAVWDDDDIFLPWRLSYSMEMMDPDKMFFKPAHAFVVESDKIVKLSKNLFHSNGIWHRDLFNKVHGYTHMGSGQDYDLEVRMEKEHVGPRKNFNGIPLDKIYYLYRWNGSGSFHLSAFGKDKDGKKSGNDKVADWVAKRIESGEVPVGRVMLEPSWKNDYTTMAQDFVTGLRSSDTNGPGPGEQTTTLDQ